MIRVALRGLSGRKLRTVLTAIAIVLGVAMMSGAYVLTDTIDKAFNAIFVESYAGTDAVISGKDAGISFEGEQSQPAPIPEDVLEQVRDVDGVEAAAGSVTDFQTKLLKPDGESIDTGGRPRSPSASTPRPSTTASIRSTSSRAAGRRGRGSSRSTKGLPTTRTSPSATGSASRPSVRRRSSRSSESRDTAT